MSAYQALYRKFRPQTFDSVIGQEHIVKTLKNQLRIGRVSHAYLFCGTRGTGKTSTAKIFAKAINCLNPVDGGPCNKCELCAAANEGRSVNIIEIDAASNNGVENIREIREEVKYAPSEGEYKVYIIDEVHMLSTGAYNALLKTLEEPPKHVIFILATTDPQKIPATILSRCQRFDFRRISSNQIAETLKEYAQEEKIDADDDALHLIARLADGSMRDSLSILDQCIAFYFGEKLTKDKVLEIVGSVDDSVFISMTDRIIKKDASMLIKMVDDMMVKGRDTSQFITDYIVHLRNLLITTSVPDSAKILNISSESAEELKLQSQNISKEEITYLINIFTELSSDIKYASNKRVLLEVCLIKLCAPVTEISYDAVAAKLSGLERELKNGKYTKTVEVSTSVKKEVEKPKKKLKKADTEDYKKALEVWNDVIKDFDTPDDILLKKTEIKQLDSDKIYIVCDNEINCHILDKKAGTIKQSLAKKLNRDFEIEVISKQEYKSRYELLYGQQETASSDFEDDDWSGLMDMPGIEIEP